jgi:thioredoxin reductase (NADPH)
MLATLEDMQTALGFTLSFIDIDDHPSLQQRFNTLIPVLARNEQIICHYHLDRPALEAALQAESK